MFSLGSVWGIDIAESGLKAVRMRRVKNRPVLEDFAIVRYADLTSDTEVAKEDLFKMALRQLLPRVGRSRMVIGIPSENVLSRFISLPPVDKARIPDLVRYEARNQIPFDLNEVLWDYQRVRKEIVPGEGVDIGLFAVRREHVDGYLSELRALGANLQGMQISPLATYNFVQADVAPEKPVIVLDMGTKTTDLIILEGGRFWVRNLRIAGQTFTQEIQRKFSLSFDDAEKVKKQMEHSQHRAKIFETLVPRAQELVSEIQRSIGFYKSLSKEAKFDEIILLGGSADLFGLQRFMADRLQYKIRTITSTRLVEIATARRDEFVAALPTLATAVGLGLQGLGLAAATVDLLPEDFVVKRELRKKVLSGVVGAALLWAGAGILWYGQARDAQNLERWRDTGKATLAKAQALSAEYEKVKGDIVPPEVANLLTLDRKREIWAVCLDGLLRAVPDYITIDNVRWAGSPNVSTAPGVMLVGEPVAEVILADEQWLLFEARTDATNPVAFLNDKNRMSGALASATVYPEKVPLFSKVLVGPVTNKDILEEGVENIARSPVGGPDVRRMRKVLEANVACLLNSEEKLAELRKAAWAAAAGATTPAERTDAGTQPNE